MSMLDIFASKILQKKTSEEVFHLKRLIEILAGDEGLINFSWLGWRDSNTYFLAGDEGFEPPILGPEPSALPLGQSPIRTSQKINTQIIKMDSTYLRQARNFSIGKLVAIGRFPCEMPQAYLTPISGLWTSVPCHNLAVSKLTTGCDPASVW
jgi:hypothetical protein